MTAKQILKHHLFLYCGNYHHLTKEGSHTLTLQSVSDLMSSVSDILTSQKDEVSAPDTEVRNKFRNKQNGVENQL